MIRTVDDDGAVRTGRVAGVAVDTETTVVDAGDYIATTMKVGVAVEEEAAHKHRRIEYEGCCYCCSSCCWLYCSLVVQVVPPRFDLLLLLSLLHRHSDDDYY